MFLINERLIIIPKSKTQTYTKLNDEPSSDETIHIYFMLSTKNATLLYTCTI